MSRIGFIGTGHIAAPMARHLVGKEHEIQRIRRNAEASAALIAARDALAKPNMLSLKMLAPLRAESGDKALFTALTTVGTMLDTKES